MKTLNRTDSLATWNVEITAVKIAPTVHMHLRVEAKGSCIDLYVIPFEHGHIISAPYYGISVNAVGLHDEHYLYNKFICAGCNWVDAASIANALSVFAEYRDRIQQVYQ